MTQPPTNPASAPDTTTPEPDIDALIRVHLTGFAAGFASHALTFGMPNDLAQKVAHAAKTAMYQDPLVRNHIADYALALWHDDPSMAPDATTLSIPMQVHADECTCDHNEDNN